MKSEMKEELIIGHVLGELTAEDRALVERWLEDSPENRQEYLRFKTLLDTSKAMAHESPLDETQAWEHFVSLREAQCVKERPTESSVPGWRKVAAVILLCGVGLLLGYRLFFADLLFNRQLVIQSGDAVRIDTLPDGSVVHLNKHSQISYASRFVGNRKVAMQGEVYFDVVHKEEPFVVTVQGLEVKDIGTVFNIKEEPTRVSVVVESGIVAVKKGEAETLVHRNQRITIQQKDRLLKVVENEDPLYNLYASDIVRINNLPMEKVLTVLNQLYHTDLRITDPPIASMRITISFRKTDPLKMVWRIIAETSPELQVKINKGVSGAPR